MGGGSFNFQSRSARGASLGFDNVHQDPDRVFTQSKEGKAHESMLAKNALVRECRFGTDHPNVIPIILELDVTGSMLGLPKFLVSEGLPLIIKALIDKGYDPSILFTAVGDQYSDAAPFQVGQFESDDEKLDNWLTKVWLEGNGGGNGGESYQIGWYHAINHVVTDAWEKEGRKGYFFSVGDEPVHDQLETQAIKKVFDITGESATTKDLLARAQEKWHVFHIHIAHNRDNSSNWASLLGDHLISVPNAEQVVNAIVDCIAKYEPVKTTEAKATTTESTSTDAPSGYKTPHMM